MNLFCLQLYTRAFIIKVFGLDDIAVCVALVCPTPFHWGHRQPVRTNRVNYQVVTQSFNGLGVAIVYYGEGLHFNKVSPEDRAMWLKVRFEIASLLPSTLLTSEKAVLCGDVPLPLRLPVRQNQLAVIPSTDLRQT